MKKAPVPSPETLEQEVAALRSRVAELERELTRVRGSSPAIEHDPAFANEIFDNLPIGILLVAPDGRVKLLNDALSRIWRGERTLDSFDAYVQYDAWDLDTGRKLEPQDWPVALALSTGLPQPAREMRIRRFDGAPGQISIHAVPLRSGGEIVGALAVVVDVTERADAERTIREAVERHERQVRLFDGVASTTPDFVYVFDTEGRFRYANRRLLEVWGMELPDIVGKTCRELGYEQWHHDMHMREIAQVIATRRPIKGEVPFKAPLTGIFGVYEYIFTPVLGPDGEVESIAGTTRDVTERKQAEEELRESEQRLRRLVEANIIGVVTADLNGVKTANDLFLRMAGATRDDLAAGRVDWVDATAPEHLDKDLRALEELRTRGWCSPFEKEYIRPDGTRVPILVGAATLKAEPLEWICFALDLSERKALEERLRDKQKLEGIGLLAGGIAHDFNNLLVGILGNASLAVELLPDGSPVRPIVDEIVRAGERAAHLTREILAYSGKGRFVIEPVSLSDAVREITALVRSSISNSVSVRFDLASDLPLVEADSAQIQQLVMNLVINAAEAIGEKPGTVSIRTAAREIGDGPAPPEFAELEPGRYVSLEVRDTGAGMDRETQSKIFDPFFTTKFTGRGLGLAAVSGIVRGHRGAIRVVSAPGDGASFEVLLPASAATVAHGDRESDELAAAAGNGTVLVVDDEEIVRRTARTALERHGYRVLLARSGQEALDLLARNPRAADLVLLDYSMPEMDGAQTLQRLRAIRPDLRVLMSSGYNEAECLELFGGQQICGFVQKPYTSATLSDRVGSALRA